MDDKVGLGDGVRSVDTPLLFDRLPRRHKIAGPNEEGQALSYYIRVSFFHDLS